MAKNKVGNIMTLFLLFVLISVGTVYGFSVMTAEQDSVNVTGTPYEESLAKSDAVASMTFGFMPYLALIIMGALIFLAVRQFRHH